MRLCSYSYHTSRVIRNLLPTMVVAPGVGGMASSAVLLLIAVGCLLCIVFHFCRAVLFPPFFPTALFFPVFFLVHLFLVLLQIVWCAGLHIFCFLRACSLRLALHGQITLLSSQRVCCSYYTDTSTHAGKRRCEPAHQTIALKQTMCTHKRTHRRG